MLPSSSVTLTERIIARESPTTTTTTTTSRDDLALPEDTDVIGGGIMKRTILYTKIRTRVTELINGYVSLPYNLEDFIEEPTWGDSVGPVGALITRLWQKLCWQLALLFQ